MWRVPSLEPTENPYAFFIKGTSWSEYEQTAKKSTKRVTNNFLIKKINKRL